ncbi:MAG: hypothetical protein QOJ29_1654 [Thermoleophilaceae bacterium]|nr:hypothetical protein [Thermoleophilaceae bacterium]
MENPNDKGNVAEAAIAFQAVRAGLAVSKPLTEHTRYDLVLEVGGTLRRVQCKWGALARDGSTIVVNLASSRFTPRGRITTLYREGEVDLVAVYCAALDRCYLLPEGLFLDKSEVRLRVGPVRNGQRSGVNLAEQYEFNGAVAQLEERRAGSAKARGSSPLSSIEKPPMAIGSDEFRNRLGYYLDLAAEGQELNISRWGKRFLRVTLWQPPLPQAEAA